MKITLGMACYDDARGVWMTVQAARWHTPGLFDEVVIIDNNPTSAHGEEVAQLARKINEGKGPHRGAVRYVPFTEKVSTSVRNEVFANATGDWVVCSDCHCLFDPKLRSALEEWDQRYPGCKDLLQGPMANDAIDHLSTHWKDQWRSKMRGTWQTDARASSSNAEPFPIDGQGLGVFACRREAWPGFNPLFRGFGGEEIYIHNKFRRLGGKVMCVPKMPWLHCFFKSGRGAYPNKIEDRIFNYIVGSLENGETLNGVFNHMCKTEKAITENRFIEITNDAVRLMQKAGQLGNRPKLWDDAAVPKPRVKALPHLERC